MTRGIDAAILSGYLDLDHKLVATKTDIKQRKFDLLYTSPESIVDTDRWHRTLVASLSEKVVAVVMDIINIILF